PDDSGHLETELAVEPGCLKIMRLQHDLATSALAGLLLDRLQQPHPVAFVAQLGRNEEIAQMAGVAPAPAIGAADNAAVRSAQKQAEQFAVVDPGRLYIELIKPVFEQPDIFQPGLGLYGRDLHD